MPNKTDSAVSAGLKFLMQVSLKEMFYILKLNKAFIFVSACKLYILLTVYSNGKLTKFITKYKILFNLYNDFLSKLKIK